MTNDQFSLLPPALREGDTIGVFAPSSFVEREDIEKSKTLLEQKGFKVFIHPQTYEREHQSAGTHLQKSLAFQGLWQRDDIKAIWAAGGGNRALHLLDVINFERLKSKPKLLIGFSDVTALLNTVYLKTGITTLHAQVFKNLHKYNMLDHLLGMLRGEKTALPMTEAKILRHGSAEGPLIGGNLSVFQYLNTPPSTPSILFLEDCNEELSKIDRMFLHLRRTHILTNCSALLVGQFSDIPETGRPFGYTLEDIIKEHTDGLNIPIITHLPFGHTTPFYPLPVGGHGHIDTKTMKISLSPIVNP